MLYLLNQEKQKLTCIMEMDFLFWNRLFVLILKNYTCICPLFLQKLKSLWVINSPDILVSLCLLFESFNKILVTIN